MRERGNGMIGLLVTLVIICLLAVVFFKGGLGGFMGKQVESSRPDKMGKTIPGLAKLAAKDDVCRSNLAQVRSAIQIAETNADDTPPTSLQDLKLGQTYYECPVGHEAYKYDPKTGLVNCVHAGHEKY